MKPALDLVLQCSSHQSIRLRMASLRTVGEVAMGSNAARARGSSASAALGSARRPSTGGESARAASSAGLPSASPTGAGGSGGGCLAQPASSSAATAKPCRTAALPRAGGVIGSMAVVRSFPGDRHVVGVGLAQAARRDAHESGGGAQSLERSGARSTPCRS